jgi:hypothetical protein|nr:MAG TPA: hypothetical protein [Caudoviricetes sp.]
MTEYYKDFLDWATPQLTLNQYRKLARIIHSFKKYNLITGQATSTLCQFKDDQVYAYTNFPKFFAEMGKLAGEYPKEFFEVWYNDNVIFWPYKETPDLVAARKRLMKKCENHVTYYRFLYIFRENQYGEITCFNIINKCYAGSPLHRCDLEKYINTLWFSPALENNHMAPRDYTIEHNTKVIIRAVSGVTNKEYKQYLFEITRPYYCTTQSYRQKEQDKAKYLFGNLNDITPYKFDETILYRLLGYIHRYKKTIEVLEQPYHKAEHNTILEYMVYIIKHLSAEGKLKKVK